MEQYEFKQILNKPLDILTHDGTRLIGVTKIIVNINRDTIEYHLSNRRLLEGNKGYTILGFTETK